MDDVCSKRDFLNRKLERETTNLEKLKLSLQRSSTETGAMLTVLDKFQERLQKLENMILPVYRDTKTFQTRLDNIDRTLVAVDNAISFYNVAKETEQIIYSDQPSKDLSHYMEAMVRVKNAIDYFRMHHPGSPEYSSVNTLYQRGKRAIEGEFQMLLNQHCKPLTAVNIAAMLGEVDDEDLGLQAGMTAEKYMPLAARDQLQEISRWLVLNLSSTDFMTVYAQTRSVVITRSLQGLIDHQKSSSGESIVSASPSVMTTFRAKRTSKKQLFAKSSRLLKKALIKNSDTAQKKEEETFVLEMECYMNCVSALLKLIEYESELMMAIIPHKHQRKVFDILVQPSLEMIVAEGEKLGATARKAASHYNFKEVPALFPLVKHLRNIKPQFDVKLEGCQPVIRSKFAALITSLDNVGNKILDFFIESIKADKATNMPVDGTVHELTTNTMHFMNTLKEHAEVVGAMLMVQDPMYSEQDAEKNTVKVADYMTKVLSALGMNLKNKAETYHDPFLAAIFMLNNYNYIQQKLQSQSLLDLIHKYDPGVGLYYENQISDYRRKYSESFARIMHYLIETEKPISQLRTAELTKLSDKERQIIKDKFTGFNKELEELCRVQKVYAIPDPKLRALLKQENKAQIVPHYDTFRQKFIKMTFTRNAEKYIKYTPHDVSDMIDRLFDVTS